MLKHAEQPANLLGLCAIPTMCVKGTNFHKKLIPGKLLALFFSYKVEQIQYIHHQEKLIFKSSTIPLIKIFMNFRAV